MRSRRAKRRRRRPDLEAGAGAQPYYVTDLRLATRTRRGRRAVVPTWGQLDPNRTPLPGKWNSLFHFLQPNQYDGSSDRRRRSAVALNENQPYGQWLVLGYPLLRRAGSRLAKAG